MKKNYTDMGSLLEIDLSQLGYVGYFAECLYRPSDEPNCMSVMIAFIKKGEAYPIDFISFAYTETDDGYIYKQDIHSTKGTIKNDLFRIVSYMCSSGIIKEYLGGDVD